MYYYFIFATKLHLLHKKKIPLTMKGKYIEKEQRILLKGLSQLNENS